MTETTQTKTKRTRTTRPLNVFGKWVSHLCIDIDTTVEDLAKEIGVSNIVLNNAMRGELSLSDEFARKLYEWSETKDQYIHTSITGLLVDVKGMLYLPKNITETQLQQITTIMFAYDKVDVVITPKLPKAVQETVKTSEPVTSDLAEPAP